MNRLVSKDRRARHPWRALLPVIIVLAGCAGAGVSTSPTSFAIASPSEASASPSEAAASPSAAPPATGQIAFHGFTDSDRAQIYLEGADGSGARRVVESTFNDQKPALSPDGTKVLFTRYAPEGSTDGGVFVVNLDGTGLTQIDKDGEDASWSPDGSQILLTRALFDAQGPPYNVSLWIMDADGTNANQITLLGIRCTTDGCTDAGAPTTGAQDNQAVWSPDGTRLAFIRDTYTSPEHFEIFTVAADGGDLQRVTPEGMNVGNPDWSPDGSLIVFQSPPEANEGGEQNIYTIHPDGTGLTQLTADLSSYSDGKQGTFQASWSPDGTQIVFAHNPGEDGGAADLYVMNSDGTDLHVLASTPLNENGPDWGPVPGG